LWKKRAGCGGVDPIPQAQGASYRAGAEVVSPVPEQETPGDVDRS